MITWLTRLEEKAGFLGSTILASSYRWSNVFNLVTNRNMKYTQLINKHSNE